MPLYPLPNVPVAPGVPPVARAAINIGITTALSLFETSDGEPPVMPPENFQTWGVFDSNGQPIGQTATLDASTFSFDYRKGTSVSDFPTEKGSFASYNKVEQPGLPAITLVVTGTSEERESFLSALDAACISTDLYSVVTPEATYVNQSIESYTYQRASHRGANILIVELILKEIRTVNAAYTTSSATAPVNAPQDPGATPQTNSGKVQPVAPPQSTLKAAANKLSSILGGS